MSNKKIGAEAPILTRPVAK